MKINMNELPDYLDEKDMAGFKELFDDIEKDAEISDEQQQRILSSVMRKAGNGMDNVIKDKRDIKGTVSEKTNETNRKIQIKRGGAIAACIAILAVGGAVFSLNSRFNSTLPNNDRDSSVTREAVTTGSVNSEPEEETKESTRSVQDWAKPYLEQNSDTVGYIKINDLTDSGAYESPVVQGDDNIVYLYKGFDKEYDERGTVFADYYVPINKNGQPSNIVLYGYYTDDQDEVSTSLLSKYTDREFFEKHKTICFSTIYDRPDTQYQVLYCCRYNSKEEIDADNFIRLRNFDSEDSYRISFDKWISNLNKCAINKSDIECTEEDDYITLAGLDYDKDEDSRIAVVAKKIKGTIYEEPSQETDGTTDNGKNSTVHKTVEKSDDTKDLKDRAKEDILSKLAEEYPTQTIYRINDDRYIISDNGKGAEKTMIYDASSDSVIFTLNGNETVIDVFEDKFGTYKFVSAGNNKYAVLDVTIFDDSGNILYKYEIDTKAAGILNGVENASEMHVSPDGKTLVYRNKEYIKDDSSLDIVDHFICFKYEDQKNPVNIADYRGCYYAYDFAVSNDMLLVDHSTEDYNRSTDLYSLDTDSKDNTAALDVFGTAAGHFPKYIPKGDSILCVIERNNTLLSIKPDDNGDIKVGDKTYTITEYELAGAEDGNKANATISDSGRYAASVYSTDDNKLVFTLYEIDDDNVTELKTIKKDLSDPEFEVLLSVDLNEQTGEFSVRRILNSTELVTEDRIDSVNFFE